MGPEIAIDRRFLAPGYDKPSDLARLIDELYSACKKLACLPVTFTKKMSLSKKYTTLYQSLCTHYSRQPALKNKPSLWVTANDAAVTVWSKVFRPYWRSNWKVASDGTPVGKTLTLFLSDIKAIVRQYSDAHGNADHQLVDCLFAGSMNHNSTLLPVENPASLTITKEYIKSRADAGLKRLGYVVSTGGMKDLPHAGHWMGLVFGLDPSDRNTFGLSFFDSLAKPNARGFEPDLMAFHILFSECFPAHEVPLRRIDPSTPLQRGKAPTSCGLFVSHFLVRTLVEGVAMEDVIEEPEFDDELIDSVLRPLYFPRVE